MRPAALLLALGATLPLPAAAGEVAPYHAERAQDRHEIRRDKRESHDDIRDLNRLEGLLGQYDRARATRDRRALLRVEDALQAELAEERAETRREMARQRAEVARGRTELRSEQREVAGDLRYGATDEARRDMRDVRDDHRDLRGDVRDLRVEAAVASRRDEIGAEFQRLRGRRDPQALDAKRGLIVELIGIASGEVRQDARELREDRRELREDWSESHADLRGR